MADPPETLGNHHVRGRVRAAMQHAPVFDVELALPDFLQAQLEELARLEREQSPAPSE